MTPRPAIDLNATVTTPENIQFGYQVAGPFRRLPAFILDLVIRGVLISGLFFALVCSGIVSLLPFSGAVLGVGMLLSYFFLDWFYGLVFETYWNGKTPGKYISKIQVISVDGRPISAYQATVRNFLRLGDMAPMMSLEVFDPDAPPIYWVPTGLVAIICMLMTKRFQRLGDLAAGTMVIVDERTWVPPSIQFEDPRVFSLAELIPANFRMSRSMGRAIALYCERRARMHTTKRLELSGILGKPLLRQFEFRDDTSTDLLLCALYYREFVSKPAVPEAPIAKPPAWSPPAATPARPNASPPARTESIAAPPVMAELTAAPPIASSTAPDVPPVQPETPPILVDAFPAPTAAPAPDRPNPNPPNLP
ncbi:MAG: RDD family protein [Pirellula sp.]